MSRAAHGDLALRRRLEAEERGRLGVQRAVAGIRARRAASGLNGITQGVFKGKDKVSGLPAFFSRPDRIRDPTGGYHTFRRRDGTTGRMPDMLDANPVYGTMGRAAGPVALTRARASVRHQPVLQEPWARMAETSADTLYDTLQDELAHALERKGQGRSY